MSVLWNAVFQAVEGTLDEKSVHILWKNKAAIESYIDKMIFSTSSLILCSKQRPRTSEKHIKDAFVVRANELLEEAIEKLCREDRRIWEYRYKEKMTLEEIGQMLYGSKKGRDSAYWRVKATRKLDYIARYLAKEMNHL